jgi:hypothetical protein
MKRTFIAAFVLAVLSLGSCQENKKLLLEQEHVADEIVASRAAANKAASAWESHIQKLNSEVLPEENFSHRPVPTARNSVKNHRKSVLSVNHGLKTQSGKYQSISNAKQADVHKLHLATIHPKPHSHLVNKVSPSTKRPVWKWHSETAAQVNLEGRPGQFIVDTHRMVCLLQLLAHDEKVASDSLPSDQHQHISAFHDTAEAMYSRRKAEVEAAFPASWSKPSTVKAAQQHALTFNPADKAWAEGIAYRQMKLNKYQEDRQKEALLKSEMETHLERRKAATAAKSELIHLSQISDKVPYSKFNYLCSD